MKHLESCKGPVPESQGQNLAVTVLCLQYPLDEDSQIFKDFGSENGSSQGQNLAVTVLYVPLEGIGAFTGVSRN